MPTHGIGIGMESQIPLSARDAPMMFPVFTPFFSECCLRMSRRLPSLPRYVLARDHIIAGRARVMSNEQVDISGIRNAGSSRK